MNLSLLEFGVAQWGLRSESGDAYMVRAFADGTLVAVIDGLGHGPDAAFAASTARSALAAYPAESPEALLTRCHEALRPTRGAVVSLASVQATGTMSWVGVGNVQAALVGSRASGPPRLLAPRGGILGHDPPNGRGSALPISRGDMLVFTTDGVRSDSVGLADPHKSPQANADRILAAGCTRRDDALVLVARYQGEPQ